MSSKLNACTLTIQVPSTNIPNNIVFMQEPIEFVSTIQLLGINISTDIYDRHISYTVRHFYCRTNEVLFMYI